MRGKVVVVKRWVDVREVVGKRKDVFVGAWEGRVEGLVGRGDLGDGEFVSDLDFSFLLFFSRN